MIFSRAKTQGIATNRSFLVASALLNYFDHASMFVANLKQ